jgi:hypothetical protein
MKTSSAHRLLPFKTFGERRPSTLRSPVNARRRVLIDGMAPYIRTAGPPQRPNYSGYLQRTLLRFPLTR